MEFLQKFDKIFRFVEFEIPQNEFDKMILWNFWMYDIWPELTAFHKKKLQAIWGAAKFMIFESFYQQKNMLAN